MKDETAKKGLTRRQFIGKSGAALLAGAAVGSGAVGPLIKISPASSNGKYKMVTAFTSPAHPTLKEIGIFKFKEVAEKLSNGKLEVELHCCMELGTELKVSQKVQLGAIQCADTSTQNFCKYVEAYNVLDFPYIFKSIDGFTQTVTDPAVDKLFKKENAKKGFLNLTYAPIGFRGLGQSKKIDKGILVPEDIKNVKVRVTGSKIEQQAFKMAGANSTPMAWAECYTGLQTGAIDALNVGIAPLYITQMYETFKYWTPINFMMNTNMLNCNLKWFNSLPDSIQEAILKASEEAMAFQQSKQECNNAICAVRYLEYGIKWLQPMKDDYAKWQEKIGHQRPEWNDWEKRVGKDLYDTIVQVSKEKEKALEKKSG